MIRNLIENVKNIKLQKGDILVVKLKDDRTKEEIDFIKKVVEDLIPIDLHAQVIISSVNVNFEILRRCTQELTHVSET